MIRAGRGLGAAAGRVRTRTLPSRRRCSGVSTGRSSSTTIPEPSKRQLRIHFAHCAIPMVRKWASQQQQATGGTHCLKRDRANAYERKRATRNCEKRPGAFRSSLRLTSSRLIVYTQPFASTGRVRSDGQLSYDTSGRHDRHPPRGYLWHQVRLKPPTSTHIPPLSACTMLAPRIQLGKCSVPCTLNHYVLHLLPACYPLSTRLP